MVICRAFLSWTSCTFIGAQSTQLIMRGLQQKSYHLQCPFFSGFIISYRYALEMHIVSHSNRYRSIAEALNEKDGVAVQAVLFKLGIFPNHHLNNILDSVRPVQKNAGKSMRLRRPLRPLELLPFNPSLYYRYSGSLTTPDCNEGIIWTVYINHLWVTEEQVDRFKQTRDSNGRLVTHNYRQLQQRNGRKIVKSSIL